MLCSSAAEVEAYWLLPPGKVLMQHVWVMHRNVKLKRIETSQKRETISLLTQLCSCRQRLGDREETEGADSGHPGAHLWLDR